MQLYDKSMYYIDFSERDYLSDTDKNELERIQQMFRPLERVDLLLEYKIQSKITADEFEQMTGVPYDFGQ